MSQREFELFGSEFERIMRESVGHLEKEKKRTTAGCGVGGSGDEQRRPAMEFERVVRVLEERGRFEIQK